MLKLIDGSGNYTDVDDINSLYFQSVHKPKDLPALIHIKINNHSFAVPKYLLVNFGDDEIDDIEIISKYPYSIIELGLRVLNGYNKTALTYKQYIDVVDFFKELQKCGFIINDKNLMNLFHFNMRPYLLRVRRYFYHPNPFGRVYSLMKRGKKRREYDSVDNVADVLPFNKLMILIENMDFLRIYKLIFLCPQILIGLSIFERNKKLRLNRRFAVV